MNQVEDDAKEEWNKSNDNIENLTSSYQKELNEINDSDLDEETKQMLRSEADSEYNMNVNREKQRQNDSMNYHSNQIDRFNKRMAKTKQRLGD